MTTDIQNFDSVRRNRVSIATKRAYSSVLNNIAKYFIEKYPNSVNIIQESEDQNAYELVLPVIPNQIRDFLGFICPYGDINTPLPDDFDPSDVKALSTVTMVRSALKWLYREKAPTVLCPISNEEIPIEFDSALDADIGEFLSGYNRRISSMRLDGDLEDFEGKEPLGFFGYVLLAKKIMSCTQQTNSRATGENNLSLGTMCWPYLVLQWNLIARSNSISKICLSHISWSGDSMIISIPKHKADQEGSRRIDAHVFANPVNPAICPILSLAVYVLCYLVRRENTLFQGHSQDARFSKHLNLILSNLSHYDSGVVGSIDGRIGTHSIRKGSSTMGIGHPYSISATATFLRAGWKLPGATSRYLLSAENGDLTLGRILAGLPMGCVEFATLPPHFDPEFLRTLDSDYWERFVPGCSQYPERFQHAIPFLIASVIHHKDFLMESLPENHPLFRTSLFTSGLISNLSLAIRLNGESTGMIASGVPEIVSLRKDLTNLREEISVIPRETVNVMLERVRVDGVQPVSREDFENFRETVQLSISNLLNDGFNRAISMDRNLNSNSNRNSIDSGRGSESGASVYHWEGRLHPVPQAFMLPTSGIYSMWCLWHFGNVISPTERYGAYSNLKAFDLPRSQGPLLSRIRYLMNRIDSKIFETSEFGRIIDVPLNLRFRCFETALNILCNQISMNRISEMSFRRLYHLFKSNRI